MYIETYQKSETETKYKTVSCIRKTKAIYNAILELYKNQTQLLKKNDAIHIIIIQLDYTTTIGKYIFKLLLQIYKQIEK